MSLSNRNNLNMEMRCIKYMLILINVLFMLTAILLLIVGTTIQTVYTDFSHFLDSNFLSVPALLVAIGFIMLLVASFGIVGGLRESTMLTNIYGVLLTIVFIMEIAAALAAFLLPAQAEAMLTRNMFDAMSRYESSYPASRAIDLMQTELECCGVHSQLDWFEMGIDYPESCCAEAYGDACLTHYSDGCLHRMKFKISQAAIIIATGATTVALVQFFGIICAFMLAKTIRRTKSLRAARAWQVQQGLGILPGTGVEKPVYEDYTQLHKSEQHIEPVTYQAK